MADRKPEGRLSAEREQVEAAIDALDRLRTADIDYHPTAGDEAVWSCKIGGAFPHGALTHPADDPMRRAVQAAYRELTGMDDGYVFSGWGRRLMEHERAVVEHRDPVYELTDWAVFKNAADLLESLVADRDALRATIDDLTAERDGYKAVTDDLLVELDEVQRRAAADTPKLQAAQSWVDAWRAKKQASADALAQAHDHTIVAHADARAALNAAGAALAAAFTEEPAAPKIAPTPRPAEPSSDVACEGSAEPAAPEPMPFASKAERDEAAVRIALAKRAHARRAAPEETP